jgi:serine/threonine protein kinase
MVEDAKIKKIEESEIQFGRMLGSGGFGLVFAAVYRSKNVAAKSIEVNDENMVADFLKEIKLMR